MQKLILPFLALLALELTGLVFAGIEFGVLPALWYTLIMIFVGLNVARKEGARLGQAWQQTVASGRPPDASFFHGMMIVAAGLCFAFPGLLSDVVGVLLLIPPVRKFAAARAMAAMGKQAAAMMANGTLPGMGNFMRPGASPFGQGSPFAADKSKGSAAGGSPLDLLLGRGFGSAPGVKAPTQVVDTQATVTDLRDKT